MLKVINLSNGYTCPNIKPTIFPDQSSQIWKLPENVLIRSSKFKIVWYFESEAEIIQLLQLNELLSITGEVVELFIPYFPYARQDKRISNETTFAQISLLKLLRNYFKCPISVFDIHNPTSVDSYIIQNITPIKFIVKALVDSKADLICFPDAGAAQRYPELADSIMADKTRDQTTGKIIEHFLVESKHSLEGKRILLVDDICDGGATFTSLAKMLLKAGASSVDLYVSHAILSQGVPVLKAAGINNIYTTNSFLGSSEMSKSSCIIYKLEE